MEIRYRHNFIGTGIITGILALLVSIFLRDFQGLPLLFPAFWLIGFSIWCLIDVLRDIYGNKK